ncbi:MAG: hypothetical protein IKL57_05540 [Oscillospiraceae bacterium]|nr:hypothetical protein [Oscillospiraceae bacterium]
MKKKFFYSEIAYILALLFIGLGVALAAKAGFGVSMIAGVTYTFHLWLSQFTDILSLGTVDYLFHGIVILLTGIVTKKFRGSYLFSFMTAVFTGMAIDLFVLLVELIPAESFFARTIIFIASILTCAFGVALVFHAYFPPAGHELFVKEFSLHFGKDMGKVKTVYDMAFCLLSVVLNLVLFGGFVGIGIGTIIAAFANGPLIGAFTRLLEKHFEFKAALPKAEKYFENY